MPQALKPLSLIHNEEGKFSQLPILALWGNKNWLPSMKVKKFEKFQNKIGSKGYKWPQFECLRHSWENPIFNFCFNFQFS